MIQVGSAKNLRMESPPLTKMVKSDSDIKSCDIDTENIPPRRKISREVAFRKQFDDIALADLCIVSTLGLGAFGRVELVTTCRRPDRSYAMKVMKKQCIVESDQQQHVINERNILFSCSSNFIVKLYKTFKDAKYLYMVMECCQGGELWKLLRKKHAFEDGAARFYAACVMEALEYLHRRGIVFRDLKCENIMLDRNGYAKLIDFGFAKKIGYGTKTYTMVGTPEYLPPEVVLNKGHDHAVDLWALGIMIYEMLNGMPPFIASDPIIIFNKVLVGFDDFEFPRRMIKSAVVLIKKLAADFPTERIGYGRMGMKDVRRTKWFDGFSFEGLRNRTLEPPIVPTIRSFDDTSNFDKCPEVDEKAPEDVFDDWDALF